MARSVGGQIQDSSTTSSPLRLELGIGNLSMERLFDHKPRLGLHLSFQAAEFTCLIWMY